MAVVITRKEMTLSRIDTQKKDINWINALKALCILFVFLRHCENYYGDDFGSFDGLFLPFYVNAFFFISGYLLFWKQMLVPRITETRKEFIVGGGKALFFNIFYRIVIPSIIFAFIEFFPKKIIKGESISFLDLFVETIGGCTYWFTSALVVAELVFLLLLMTRNRNVWFYVIIAFVFSVLGKYLFATDFSFLEGHSSFPWLYKHGLLCMCYMAFGALYWRYETTIRMIMNKWFLIPLAAAYFVGSIVFKSYLYDGYMTSMGRLHPVGVIWSVIATTLLIEVCKRIPRIPFLTFIGQNSIGFYFMSGALPIVFSLVAKRIIPGLHSLAVLLVFFCCVSVSYVAMKVLKRWTPWLFDLRLINKQLI